MQRFYSSVNELIFSLYLQTVYFLTSRARIVNKQINGCPTGLATTKRVKCEESGLSAVLDLASVVAVEPLLCI